jgi:uncharacterized membrane protein
MVPKFSKKEAINFGWNVAKKNLGFFALLLILAFFISFASAFLSTAISIIVDMLITIGLIKISLKFCDNEKAKISDLFSSSHLFFNFLIGNLLYALIIIGGFILLIIPGIIWSIKYRFFNYFIVDKGLGPIEALKESARITKGNKWNLFLFGLLLVLIDILGALALLVGLFVTIPTTMIANAFVYRKLLSQTETLQETETSSS